MDRPGQGRPVNLKASSGPRKPRSALQTQAKEVFEMAASLLIEEESGTYTTRFRHPHNGYYAGDFFQTPHSGAWSQRPPAGSIAGGAAGRVPWATPAAVHEQAASHAGRSPRKRAR